LSSSSHFAPIAYSNAVNPVVLPPGRAKLLTKPAPTGSGAATKTTGTERVAPCNALTPTAPSASMTSGMSATNSAQWLPRTRGGGAHQPRAPAVLRLPFSSLSGRHAASIESRCNGPQGTSAGPLHVPDDREDICRISLRVALYGPDSG